jgi:hypothetical protein
MIVDQKSKGFEVHVGERNRKELEGLKVAYVMSRFPKLTETFILYEMLAMRRHGIQVEVYPLLREHERRDASGSYAIRANRSFPAFYFPANHKSESALYFEKTVYLSKNALGCAARQLGKF